MKRLIIITAVLAAVVLAFPSATLYAKSSRNDTHRSISIITPRDYSGGEINLSNDDGDADDLANRGGPDGRILDPKMSYSSIVSGNAFMLGDPVVPGATRAWWIYFVFHRFQ
jgi:hypothetical protein